MKTASQMNQGPSGAIKTATQMNQGQSGAIKTATQMNQGRSGAIKTATQMNQGPSGAIKTATQMNQGPSGASSHRRVARVDVEKRVFAVDGAALDGLDRIRCGVPVGRSGGDQTVIRGQSGGDQNGTRARHPPDTPPRAPSPPVIGAPNVWRAAEGDERAVGSDEWREVLVALHASDQHGTMALSGAQ